MIRGFKAVGIGNCGFRIEGHGLGSEFRVGVRRAACGGGRAWPEDAPKAAGAGRLKADGMPEKPTCRGGGGGSALDGEAGGQGARSYGGRCGHGDLRTSASKKVGCCFGWQNLKLDAKRDVKF